MKKGKLIVIEGTDCSGKETQSKMLAKRLSEDNIPVFEMQFPKYDTPTGKIIGGAYLGKKEYGESLFPEGASSVPAKVASLYYAADRLYNVELITSQLDNGVNVILDRYVESNMAHQGGKLESKEERNKMIEFLDTLEYNLLELPRPDKVYFLHMPYENAKVLRDNRKESADGHEKDENHLKNAERAYLELAKKYNFFTIDCTKDNNIRTIEDINNELYEKVRKLIDG